MASQELTAPLSDPNGAFGVLVENLSTGSPEAPASAVPVPSAPPASPPSGDAADQPLLPVASAVEAEASPPSPVRPEAIAAPTPLPSRPTGPTTTEAPEDASSASDEQPADAVGAHPVSEKITAPHGALSTLAVQPELVIERPAEKEAAKKEEASVNEDASDGDVTMAAAPTFQPVSLEARPVVAATPAPGGDALMPDDGATQQAALAEVAGTAVSYTIPAKPDAATRTDPPAEPKEDADTVDIRPAAAPTGFERPSGEAGTETRTIALPSHMAKADGALPSPLLTQTLGPVVNNSTASPYPVAPQIAATSPVVQARPGRLGADIGVQIARAAKGDREDLLIRLDPRDMGRINVHLSFDREGTLRAVMSADSPTALDMLRRESGDLNRALVDAGIRHDAQSLRFDARSGDQGQGAGSGQGWQRGQQEQGNRAHFDNGGDELADLEYRPLRASGQVDLMA